MEDRSGSDVEEHGNVLPGNVVDDVDTSSDEELPTTPGSRRSSQHADERRSSVVSAKNSGGKIASGTSSKGFGAVQLSSLGEVQNPIDKRPASIDDSMQEALAIQSQGATTNRVQNILSTKSQGALANTIPIQRDLSTKSHGAISNTVQGNLSSKHEGAKSNTAAKSNCGTLGTGLCAAMATGGTNGKFDPLLEYRRSLIGTKGGSYIKRLYRGDYYEVFGANVEKAHSRAGRSPSNSLTSGTYSNNTYKSRMSSKDSSSPSRSSKSSGKRQKRSLISEKLFYIDWFRKMVIREHKIMFPKDKPLYPNLVTNLHHKI